MSSITDAVLWVNHPGMMFERLGGMSLLERQLFTLSQTGLRRVWVAAEKPPQAAAMRLPPRLDVRWIPRDADGPLECRTPYLGVSGDHLIRREALEGILSRRHDGHVSYQDESRRGVVQVLPFRGERVLRYRKEPLPAGTTVLLRAPSDKRSALPWLLAGVRKAHDGFMARNFDRRISLAVTRLLLRTPLRPNHMTVFSSLLGVAGALQFASGDYARGVAGALLIWLHSVLDGCDGEMARLKYQESRFGGTLDFWGDNVVHVALFLSLAAGLYRAAADPRYLALGAVAAAAALGSAILGFRNSIKHRRADDESSPVFQGVQEVPADAAGPAGALQRVENALAQRDFIYLLVAAALLGRTAAFLWAAAIGAPLFFFVLLYLTLRSHGTGTPSRSNA